MANNRMWLIHTGSCLGIMLGKRMGDSYYNAPDKDELERFYEKVVFMDDYIETGETLDSFILAFENDGVFEYTNEYDDGFHKLKLRGAE